MLYWFFVKGLGPIAIHRMGPTAKGLENIPREGGAIIAANHPVSYTHLLGEDRLPCDFSHDALLDASACHVVDTISPPL